MTWDLIYTGSPTYIGTEDEVLASAARQVGISIKLISKTFNYITSELSYVSNPTHDKLWAMEDFGGFGDQLYPSTDQLFNSEGSFNFGGFSDRAVDASIQASEYSLDDNAVKAQLGLVTAAQPGLFQPNPDLLFAFKGSLSGPPSSFESASQYQYEPNYWYFKR
jgi:peptide/nickel transport system substrate-binding protein